MLTFYAGKNSIGSFYQWEIININKYQRTCALLCVKYLVNLCTFDHFCWTFPLKKNVYITRNVYIIIFRGPGELDNSAIVEALKARNAHYEQLVADALKNIPTK